MSEEVAVAAVREVESSVSILLKDVGCLVTFDDDQRELKGVDVLLRNGVVAAIEDCVDPPAGAEVIDARGLVVLPGLVNAHQHLYQVGFRSFPELERVDMGGWLGGLHARTLDAWRSDRFTPESVGLVAKAGMVESVLSGVTTIADQHYIFPGGRSDSYIESMISAATDVGIRLHAGRGSMTLGRTRGGSVPDEVCQEMSDVLDHAQRLIEDHHDPDPFAKIRIDLAPCGLHVDRREMFEEFVALADANPGVGLHTHAYQEYDTDFCLERFNATPWQVLGELGWQRRGVWLAHMVDVPHSEIQQYAAAGVGIVHVPAPDLRLGWGLAPVRAYLEAGCILGFGTTGSASNDGSNQLGDVRLAALAHRTTDRNPKRWPTVRELLHLATRGSADCLNRPVLGRLSVGSAADIAAWSLESIDRVGVHDPVGGLVLTGISDRCELVIVGGNVVVRGGRCITVDESELALRARTALADQP
ncbi:MAG: amidohydrolase family protein [Acidimicrobiia bacterium]|nr:amidohydrolase family protein [Acidimicrobiia bacterium]